MPLYPPRRLAFGWLIASALLLQASHAVGQTAAGSVSGQVKDGLDRPVSGARVVLQDVEGREVGAATSGPDGRFSLPRVPSGMYSVTGSRADFDDGAELVTVGPNGAQTTLVLSAKAALSVAVQAQKLDDARSSIAPSLGATVYDINRKALESQAQGDAAPFNQTLARAPGVAQDSFGQIHVRGDHANLQYRINGVLIPEGITGFGNVFDTRLADRVALITGALPAQYGYRTSAIVDIETKSGLAGNGGSMGMYGGSNGTLNPSAEAYGTAGGVNYYVTGNYLQNNIGIENPTASSSAIHDESQQGKGFAYISGLLSPTARLSLLAGSAVSNFHIPNNPGQSPGNGDPAATNGLYPFFASGPNFNSAQLNAKQKEINDYSALSLQQTTGDVDYQISLFGRYSSVRYEADSVGDLFFRGSAQSVYRNTFASGLQGDGSWKLNDAHTLRPGFTFTGERAIAKNQTTTFLADPATGFADTVNTAPVTIGDQSSKWGYLYGVYLQDEWKLSPAFTLNYGARFDVYNAYVNDNQLSPRINATYKVTDATVVHAGYARYFTPPSLELVSSSTLGKFSNTILNPTVQQNDTPKVEKSHYFDAGVNQQFTPEFKMGLGAYYKIAEHLIDEGFFGQPVVPTIFNYRFATVYGAELSSNFDRGPFGFYGNLGFSIATGKKIESSQFSFDPVALDYINSHYIHLDHDQRFTISTGVSYEIDGFKLTADLLFGSGLRRTPDSGGLSDGTGVPNGKTLNAYDVENIGVSKAFTTQWLGTMVARADILNVLDHSYLLRDGTGVGVGAPQYGLRRAYFAGLTKTF